MFSKGLKTKRFLGYFTLTEILAVAAIVSAIPPQAYERVKKKAVQTECANNLSQIGQLLRMYVLENDHYPEAPFYPTIPGQSGKSIRTVLGGPDQLWNCPSLPEALNKNGLTFVYNDNIAGKTSLENPDKKWVLIEMTCSAKGSPHPHPGGYNILFADGHVISSKTLPKRITKAQKSSANRHIKSSNPASGTTFGSHDP